MKNESTALRSLADRYHLQWPPLLVLIGVGVHSSPVLLAVALIVLALLTVNKFVMMLRTA